MGKHKARAVFSRGKSRTSVHPWTDSEFPRMPQSLMVGALAALKLWYAHRSTGNALALARFPHHVRVLVKLIVFLLSYY